MPNIYLQSGGSPPITPAYHASWDNTSNATRYVASTVKAGSSMTTLSIADSNQVDLDFCLGQWIFGPVAAQTISAQTVRIQMRGAQRLATNNMFLVWVIRVIAADGSTVRGTIVGFRRDGTEFAVSATSNQANFVNRGDSLTSTSVSAQAGDYIVIEVGVGGDPDSGSDHDSYIRIGDSAGSDLGADDTDTADNAPYVFFTNTINTGTAHEGAASLAGAASLDAAGRWGAQGVTSLAAAASVTAAGRRGARAATALSAVGSVTVVGRRGQAGVASLASAASVTAVGKRGAQGASALSAVGSITPVGTVILAAARASLASIASVTAVGHLGAGGAASLAATASMSADGRLGASGAALLSAIASLSPAGKRGVLAAVSLAAAASLSANGRMGAGGRTSLAAAASLAAAGRYGAGGRVSLAVVASMTAAGRLGAGGRVSLIAIGTLEGRAYVFELFIPPPRIRPRIYIHDAATRRRLAQLVNVSSINRSYALREHVRQAEFDLAVSDELAYLTDTRAAHIVYIESNEYPLPWVGRIIERVVNHADRTFTIYADSYEAVLAERPLPSAFTTPRGAEQAMAHILNTTNARNDTAVQVGHSDALFAPPMGVTDARAIEALDKLVELAGAEWWLSFLYSQGDLGIYLNLAQERGADFSHSVTLSQPGNFEIASSRENGRAIAYAQTVVGGESDPLQGFTGRERATATRDSQFQRGETAEYLVEAQRVFRHGHLVAGETSFRAPTQRREYLAVREELKEAGLTPEAAVRLLERQRMPYRSVMGRAYPDIEGQAATSWRYLEPGNVVRLNSADAFGSGYDGPAVVVGVQPVEHQRFMDVVLEVA